MFANEDFIARTSGQFAVDMDPDTRRTTNSAPAGHIKSLADINVSGSATWYLTPAPGTNPPLSATTHVLHRFDTNSLLLGKRIRISGWIKAKDVRNWAGGTLSVWNSEHNYGFDDSTSRPVLGTADWQPIEFVAELPKEPCIIAFEAVLYGNGEIWFDDFRLDVVAPDTPVTGDRGDWRFFGASPADYSETTDYTTTHNGHPAFCIAYTPPGTAPPGAKIWWGKEIYSPETAKYIGHTVQMTVWTKSENISGAAQPAFHPRDINAKIIAREQGDQPIRGTTDWTQHTFTCRIPPETDFINTGFNFSGGGKIWIDLDSIKFKIIK